MTFRNHTIEILEARIAPAAASAPLLPTTAVNAQTHQPNYVTATLGAPILVTAGQVLSTGGFNAGSYLLYVEQGECEVFTTDLNNNNQVDFNEITGIAAGNGLEMVCFVDIHGDIATNLKESVVVTPGVGSHTVLSLSDSDNNASDDAVNTGGDGRVLLNNTINKIEMRPLALTDIPDLNGDGVVNQSDLAIHQAYTTCSIFGTIYAGKGFGTVDGTGGLIINATNAPNFGQPVIPTIGSIKTGSAASGEFFSYGANAGNSTGITQLKNDDGSAFLDSKGNPVFEQDNPAVSGTFVTFTAPAGQAGGDINGVHVIGTASTTTTGTTGTTTTTAGTAGTLNLDTLHAGDGGVGARGGNITNVVIPMDDSGGYQIIAGNGGAGPTGGNGGTISHFSDLGSTTGQILIQSGSGGRGITGAGGNGGDFNFDTFTPRANVQLTLGDGGEGFTQGGNGASLLSGTLSQVSATAPSYGLSAAGTTHVPSALSNGPLDPSSALYLNYVKGLSPDESLSYATADPTDPTAQVQVSPFGSSAAIDFNGDGFGDYVISTGGATSELLVNLGDPFGGFDKFTIDPVTHVPKLVLDAAGNPVPNQISLDGVRNGQAMVVADLNGDGHPDIAVASSDSGSQEGIAVFLSKYDANGKFLGFDSPRFSVLPQLQTGDNNTANASLPFVESPQQISQIEAGDFNGDGKIELAVVVTQYVEKTTTNGQTTDLSVPYQAVVYMQPAIQDDFLHKTNGLPDQVLTGQFYADFGTKGFNTKTQQVAPLPKYPIVGGPLAGESDLENPNPLDFKAFAAGPANSLHIQASPISLTAGHDSLFVGAVGTTEKVDTIDYVNRAIPNNQPAGGLVPPVLVGDYNLGQVDEDHIAGGDHVNPAKVNLQSFSVFDYNHDGNADLAAISTDLFLVGVSGDGSGGGTQTSGNGGDQSGNYFGPPPGGFNITPGGLLLQVKTGEFNGHAGVTVVDNQGGSGATDISSFTYVEGPENAALDGFRSIKINAEPGATPTNNTAFDIHYLDASSTLNGFVTATPGTSLLDGTALVVFTDDNLGDEILFDKSGLGIHAGTGGSSLLGRGGAGGNIGGGSLVASKTDFTVDPSTGTSIPAAVGSLNLTLAGDIVLLAGQGGDGFTLGGHGGNVSGVNLQYRQNDIGLGILATAGDGGRGVSGAGGGGGNVTHNSFATSLAQTGIVDHGLAVSAFTTTLTAGAGGEGFSGGAGGSILGNGTSRFDTDTSSVVATAGAGGDGTKTAGAGGSILNFIPIIPPLTAVGGSGIPDYGFIKYTAGNGGTSVSAHGGSGGSIINSAPAPNASLDSSISLVAGDGGDGRTGGTGGTVNKFLLSFIAGAQPTGVTIRAGEGGNGKAGNGGAGGTIANINAPSSGTDVLLLFNSIIAGDGGTSAGGAGGVGGGILNVTSASSNGSFALIAGAGGDGLYAGGRGGNVTGSTLALGASTQKGLVIAGAGGEAYAFVPNNQLISTAADPTPHPVDPSPNQPLNAFGGRAGVGGAGGTINGFTQSGNNGAHIDLIAGNGGDTLNFGTFFDKTSHVGNGGSILNVRIAGDIGNIAENVPIKSYNDVAAGQTIRNFVVTDLRPLDTTTPLNDSLGNVGAVVGAAGSNKMVLLDPVNNPQSPTPVGAPHAVNGSLVNITFGHLMAAVAGSVDQIASIQVARNLRFTATFEADKTFGADKDPSVEGVYVGTSGAIVTSPELGGELIDGAVVAKSFVDANGNPTQISGRETRLG